MRFRPFCKSERDTQAGMVTAELAVAMPALVSVVALLLAVVGTASDTSKVSDAARSVARSLSIGTDRDAAIKRVRDMAPTDSQVNVSYSSDQVTVVVAAPARSWGPLQLPSPRATAVANLEPGVVP
jgi:Flp pilus assembly protein TadG